MHISTITRLFALSALIISLNTSCKKNLEFDEPPHNCGTPAPIKANTSIADLVATYQGQDTLRIPDGIIIEGIVQSTDREGNFFKQLIIHDGTAGIEFRPDVTGLYTTYPVGQKVVIDAGGMYLGQYGNQVQLGGLFMNTTTNVLGFGRIAQPIVERKTFTDGCKIEKMDIDVIRLSDVDDSHLNKIIELEDVYFASSELGKTYADATNQNTENRNLTDDSGAQIIVRTSGFAAFARDSIPSGRGSLRAVLTKFGSTYQLIINRIEEVKLNTWFDRDGSGTAPTANKTIADLKAAYTSSSFQQITDDWVIEGVVTANDAEGNFFKELYIQDASAALRVRINKTALTSDYQVGQKVVIKTRNLYLSQTSGDVELGTLFNNNTQFGGIEPGDIAKFITKVPGGSSPSPTTTSISGLNSSLLGQLIRLDNVQFDNAELGNTYVPSNASFPQNRTIQDCNGNTIILRTSNFANFASAAIPNGNGILVGILGVFNGTYQIYIRNTSEVMFNAARCTVGGGGGGGTILLQENFEGITTGSGSTVVPISISGWSNFALVGTDRWEGRSFSGNKFAQFSSNFSNDNSNETWLITPGINLDNTANDTLTFISQVRFYTHNALEVFISTNWNGTQAGVATATWTPLAATLPTSAADNDNWINSGNVILSSYSGTAHIAFKYTGSKPNNQDCTMRVDDIVIKGL